MRVWWRNDNTHLYLAAEAKAEGWIGVGLAPDNRMQGANYIIASMAGGQPKIFDAWGLAPTGATHPQDTEQGGKNDIVAYSVVRKDGVTRFEAQIPLNSGDKYDKPLKPGDTVKIIVAYGASDDYNARHPFRATGEIVLDKAQ